MIVDLNMQIQWLIGTKAVKRIVINNSGIILVTVTRESLNVQKLLWIDMNVWVELG